MVTRVRIDAEGRTVEEVQAMLDASFQLIFQNSVTNQFQFVGPAFRSEPYGPTQVVPRDSEFVEEVFETFSTPAGAIRYRGRRIIAFHASHEEMERAHPLPAVLYEDADRGERG